MVTNTTKPKLKFKKFGKLPGKPSALIRLALADLKKIERSKRYVVDMHCFHEPNGKCKVCFAGAIMAKTLNSDIKEELEPYQLPKEEKALYALDAFRKGEIWEGLCCLLPAAELLENHIVQSCWLTKRHICRYEDNPAIFKRDMADLAIALEYRNL